VPALASDLSKNYPEVIHELEKLPDCVLDGELVVLDDKGRSHFDRLRHRLAMKTPSAIQKACGEYPAALFAFDLLWLEGRDLRKLPLLKRKETLKRLLKAKSRICHVQHVGQEESVYSKRQLNSNLKEWLRRRLIHYRKGKSYDWVKIKTPAGKDLDEMRAKWSKVESLI
jgi:bifunctional non-homologous end joining protein LigD